jgi:RNA polymerase sigma-70 factor (TIGR02943 family)
MSKHELIPENWVDKYSDLLLNFAVIRLRDTERSKDLVQETFFVALRSKDSFRGEISEKNWLFLILKSRILDFYKKKREVNESQFNANREEDESSYFLESGHWSKEEAPQSWAPDKMAESKEFMSILNRCTEKLKELQLTVFTMKYMDDIDSETICKELGITDSNYWVLIHRAKMQLRKCLEINWIK